MAVTTRSFTCLACSGKLEFTAGSVSTRCKMCEDDRPLPMRFPADVPAVTLDAAPSVVPGIAHARCRSCGTLLASASPPLSCPICAGETAAEAVVATLPVHGWLPFLVDEHTARALLTAELQRLRITAMPARFAGVHLPWLVYECAVKASYDGRRGDLQGDGNNDRMVWSSVSGVIERPFENRRSSASRSIVGDLADRLEPWDWAFAEPPSAALATGVSECCEMKGDSVAARAMGQFESDVAAEVRSDIGGDAQEIHRLQATRHSEKFRQILLPAWIGTIVGTEARFAVNGRTGEVIIAGFRGRDVEESQLEPESGAGHRKSILLVLGVAFVLLLVLIRRC